MGQEWTGQALLADQLLLARLGQIDLGTIFINNESHDVSVHVACNSDLWIADEQVVHLVAELDELLLCWGLFICDHVGSIGARSGHVNSENGQEGSQSAIRRLVSTVLKALGADSTRRSLFFGRSTPEGRRRRPKFPALLSS